jgi:dTDP-4-dehydrorhamnose reductase
MAYERILLTGGSGKLGSAVRASGLIPGLIAPGHGALDITKPAEISWFFDAHPVDAVIHCAALARMLECETHPARALETNIIGTCLLVAEVLKREAERKKGIRFVYLSTDGVYAGDTGNFSERAATIPYNRYGWTKLGGECAVRMLSNFCIVRTSFFDPAHIPFAESATDVYSSRLPIGDLVKAIAILLNADFIGTINVGDARRSEYERYKEYKSTLRPCTYKEIARDLPFTIARDASLDLSAWKKLKRRRGNA